MKAKLKSFVFFFAGILATLFVQWLLLPGHAEMAAVKSPDGTQLFVVDRYDPGLIGMIYSADVPWRTFSIYRFGIHGERVLTDGAVYRASELASGGMDMTNMQIYWQGETAVADFSHVCLERTFPEDNWRWVQKPTSTLPAATSAPTTAS